MSREFILTILGRQVGSHDCCKRILFEVQDIWANQGFKTCQDEQRAY